MELPARLTLLAEGCRGSLTRDAVARYRLDAGAQAQTYGLGMKELWRLPARRRRPGNVLHTAGWPLRGRDFGGGFFYEGADGLAHVGFVAGLDYANPWLDPFQEFQRFKTHPALRALLGGGERVAFGARAVAEGGVQALPRLDFPGGALVGDAAGLLNVASIKGIHAALFSGVLAAEAAFAALAAGHTRLDEYPRRLRGSWLWRELRRARNLRPAMRRGLAAGTLYAGLDLVLCRGRVPWTLALGTRDRGRKRRRAAASAPIAYPPPDGVLTFDRASSAYLSGVNHRDGQPVHLRFADPERAGRFPLDDAPEPRLCPVGVFETVSGPGARARLQVNAQNCVHCKACEIRDPDIQWTPPEGGGGPHYNGL